MPNSSKAPPPAANAMINVVLSDERTGSSPAVVDAREADDLVVEVDVWLALLEPTPALDNALEMDNMVDTTSSVVSVVNDNGSDVVETADGADNADVRGGLVFVIAVVGAMRVRDTVVCGIDGWQPRVVLHVATIQNTESASMSAS